LAETVFFISDLHLGLQSPEKEKEKERLLIKFLEYSKDKSNKLIILGDLFDYWFEYKRVIQKGFFRTLTALQDIAEYGIEVKYLIGNHDFLHRDFFEKVIGVKLFHDPFVEEINNKRFYLSHGDGLVANDTGYNILKKILRNKFLQAAYSLLHPDFGIWLASSTSKKSRDYTSDKNYGLTDGLYLAAKDKIDEGFDYVLFGHSHQRKFEKYKNGYYINLGSWLSEPCYGKFTEDKFEIIEWK
jgi:UDP-2,3-diacylglucosamine hydrolase